MTTPMEEHFEFEWKKVVQLGLVAGLVAVFVCLVGMVHTFGKKDVIGGLITQGYMLLVLVWIGFGYSINRQVRGGTPQQTVAGGAVVGGIASLMLVILALIAEPFSLRNVLVNASPDLTETLTFTLGSGVGSIVNLVIGAALGALGAAVPLIPERVRRPLINSLMSVLVLGVFQDVLDPILPDFVSGVLFAISGLSIVGAIIVLLVVAGGNVWWSQQGESIRQRASSVSNNGNKTTRWIMFGVGLVLVLLIPQLVGSFISDVLSTIGLYILMGLGLNIVVGYAGLLDLGYVAFFAIGAYVAAVLTSTAELGLGLNFWLAVPFAVLGSVICGVLLGIPVLQMRGDYLAIVTMGFGEIIRLLVLSDALRPWLGGAQGILAVPKINILGWRLGRPQQIVYLIFGACLLAVFISRRLADSRIGRAWMAIREDEDVAEAMGIGLVKHKLMAFAAGAAFAGLSGAIFASKLGSIFPHSFRLEVSIWVLCLIIVGGMGSIPGVVVGALFMMGLPEVLRTFAEYRLLFYGAILVLMMLVRPEGLWPEEARRRELHAGEDNDVGPAAPEPSS